MDALPQPVLWVVVFAAGIAAGLVNTLAGGGSLVTLPVLMIVVGLPAPIANGTSRVAVLVQSLTAAATYRRAKLGGGKLALRLAPFVCAGSLAGAWLATRASPGSLKRTIGGVLLACVPLVIFSARLQVGARAVPRRVPPALVAAVALAVGVYSGFLQAVVGIPILLLLVWGLGVDAVEGNHTKVLVIAASMAVALTVFAHAGQVDYVYGGISAAGQALGAWIGARLVIKKGLTVIRWALALTVTASALQMLGVFG